MLGRILYVDFLEHQSISTVILYHVCGWQTWCVLNNVEHPSTPHACSRLAPTRSRRGLLHSSRKVNSIPIIAARNSKPWLDLECRFFIPPTLTHLRIYPPARPLWIYACMSLIRAPQAMVLICVWPTLSGVPQCRRDRGRTQSGETVRQKSFLCDSITDPSNPTK